MISNTLRITATQVLRQAVCETRRVKHSQLDLRSPSFTVASLGRYRRLSTSPETSDTRTEYVALKEPVSCRDLNDYISSWEDSRHLLVLDPPDFIIHEDIEQLFEESGFHV